MLNDMKLACVSIKMSRSMAALTDINIYDTINIKHENMHTKNINMRHTYIHTYI